MKKLALALWLILVPSLAYAATATIYIDTGGCVTGSTTRCSGTTDSATPIVSGASATITCSAVAGPAGGVGCSLSGSPDLSGVATDGSQAIFVNCATNSNQKIFFINAVDDAGDLVGTTVAPTGCTASSSDWGIGGRMIYNSANIEAAVRPGDTILFNNTPATKAATFFTARVSGDSTSGFITLRGKTGVRPVLEVTNTSVVYSCTSIQNWYVTNLELKQGGASGSVANLAACQGTVFDNIKITDGGGDCINSNNNVTVLNSELSGCGGSGISASGTTVLAIGNYIHDNAANGIVITNVGPNAVIANNIIASNTARGVYFSGAINTATLAIGVLNNTFYNNGDSGLEVADADLPMVLRGNIFHGTGTPFNVEWAAGSAELHGSHGYNVFYISGGANNVSGLTINSTESTNNPNLTNPGAGDFSINSTSSAANAGFPGTMLGGSSVGYQDIGAIQRNASAGASGRISPGIGQ